MSILARMRPAKLSLLMGNGSKNFKLNRNLRALGVGSSLDA
jgi:hypothetical protein